MTHIFKASSENFMNTFIVLLNKLTGYMWTHRLGRGEFIWFWNWIIFLNQKSSDVFLFLKKINLVRILWLEGLARTEPPLSRACCVGPVLYLPIAQFAIRNSQFAIRNSIMTEFRVESLTYAHSRARPVPIAGFNWLRPATNRNHTRQDAR